MRKGTDRFFLAALALFMVGHGISSGEILLQSGLEGSDIRRADGVVPGESRQWSAEDFLGNTWNADGVLLRATHGRVGPRAAHFDGEDQTLTVTIPGGFGIGEVSFWYHPLSSAPSDYTVELHVREGDAWVPAWQVTHEETELEWTNAIVEVDAAGANEIRWVMTEHSSRGIMLDDFTVSSHGTTVGEGGVAAPSLRGDEESYTFQSERASEGWGVIFNEDGDFAITDPDPEVSAQYTRDMLAVLEGTPVKTVMHSIGAGSDILYYPSGYGSYWGWRDLPNFEDHAVWGPRIRAGRAVGEAGADMIMPAAEIVNEMGMHFLPSVRMNDAHFVFDAVNYPLTGEFWMNNQHLAMGDSPILSRDYGAALSFLEKEVRDYRFGIISEVVDRYGEVMVGIELDYNRFQILFPRGRAAEGMPLLTSFMRDVRALLDSKSAETGIDYTVFVRVPPSVRNSHWAGMDLETWAVEGLVDVVIPSQLMTIAHDMPVREFVDLLSPHGVEVMPTIYERTQFNPPMTVDVPSAIRGEDFDRIASAAQVAGVIINALEQGATNFQLYNFDIPPSQYWDPLPWTTGVFDFETPLRASDMRIMDYINNPSLIEERVYMVTPGYFLDHEDSYQYSKQIPLALEPGTAHTVTMMIGEDLSDAEALSTTRRTFRAGFSKPLAAGMGLRLAINDTVVHDGPLADALVPVIGQSRGAQSYVYLSLDGRDILHRGENELSFTLTPREGGEMETTELVEVQLLVAPAGGSEVSMQRRGQ